MFFAAFQALLYVLCYHLEGLMQPQPPAPAADQQQGQPQDPQQPDDGGLPAAVQALFQSVMPQLLAHRLSPLAACNATVRTRHLPMSLLQHKWGCQATRIHPPPGMAAAMHSILHTAAATACDQTACRVLPP